MIVTIIRHQKQIDCIVTTDTGKQFFYQYGVDKPENMTVANHDEAIRNEALLRAEAEQTLLVLSE